MMDRDKPSSRPSQEQKEMFADFLEANPVLLKLNGMGGPAKIDPVRWVRISEQLNALRGSHKSCEQWRKVWFDKKVALKNMLRANIDPADLHEGFNKRMLTAILKYQELENPNESADADAIQSSKETRRSETTTLIKEERDPVQRVPVEDNGMESVEENGDAQFEQETVPVEAVDVRFELAVPADESCDDVIWFEAATDRLGPGDNDVKIENGPLHNGMREAPGNSRSSTSTERALPKRRKAAAQRVSPAENRRRRRLRDSDRDLMELSERLERKRARDEHLRHKECVQVQREGNVILKQTLEVQRDLLQVAKQLLTTLQNR